MLRGNDKVVIVVFFNVSNKFSAAQRCLWFQGAPRTGIPNPRPWSITGPQERWANVCAWSSSHLSGGQVCMWIPLVRVDGACTLVSGAPHVNALHSHTSGGCMRPLLTQMELCTCACTCHSHISPSHARPGHQTGKVGDHCPRILSDPFAAFWGQETNENLGKPKINSLLLVELSSGRLHVHVHNHRTERGHLLHKVQQLFSTMTLSIPNRWLSTPCLNTLNKRSSAPFKVISFPGSNLDVVRHYLSLG